MRNPNGLAWQPDSGELGTTVNERDFLGGDLVPDYMTSLKDGGFYGWPYSYWGSTSIRSPSRRVRTSFAKAIVLDCALGALPPRSVLPSTRASHCRSALPVAPSSPSTGSGAAGR